MRFHDQGLGLGGNTVLAARVISRLTPAPLINFYVGTLLSLVPPGTGLGPILSPVESVAICLVFMVVLPAAPIVIQAWRGIIDLDVSDRTKRAPFFLSALLCYSCAYALYLIYQSLVMRTLAAAYIAVTFVVMVVSLREKVSVHAAGIGGPGTVLIYMYGPVLLCFLLPLWCAVVWSRTALQQHTLTEGVAGLTIGVVVSLAVCMLFY